jgi:hypothetical protein
MRCGHLDAVALGQVSVQAVTVVRFVADQSCWEEIEEALPDASCVAFEKAFPRKRLAFAAEARQSMEFQSILAPKALPKRDLAKGSL